MGSTMMEGRRIMLQILFTLLALQLCASNPIFYEPFDELFEKRWTVPMNGDYKGGVLQGDGSISRNLLQDKMSVVLQGDGSISRSLLQAKTSCPINFEFMNYQIITNKCKGPQYSPTPCCSALKEFACPYAEQLNDLTNDCATTMFSYINLYGKYPPGLFAYECREGKEGLDCSNYISKVDNSTSSAKMIQSLSPVIATALGVTVALLVY